MNEKSPLKVIKKGIIGNKTVDGETTTGDEMDIDDSLVLDIQEDMEEGSKNISGTLSTQNTLFYIIFSGLFFLFVFPLLLVD
jgi:hypothetical protein